MLYRREKETDQKQNEQVNEDRRVLYKYLEWIGTGLYLVRSW